MECVGGNNETYCFSAFASAEARWCSEPGVQYYILLGGRTAADIGYSGTYHMSSLGACEYVGGNCVPEVVFAPAHIFGTTHFRDDCCWYDAADVHYLVYLPYPSTWRFFVCSANQPAQRIGSEYCGNDICEETANNLDPPCVGGSVCDCMPLDAGYYHVTIQTNYDDGLGDPFEFMINDCGGNNIPNPIDLDPVDITYVCELVVGGGYRVIRVFDPSPDPNRPPILTLSPGCEDCDGEPYSPANAIYDPNGWVLHPGSPNVTGQENPYWENVIIGEGQGYVCIHLEGFLPVNLLDFSAIANEQEVRLRWTTASEDGLDRFVLKRDGIEVASVHAMNSASGSAYTFVDQDLENGTTYHYSLYAVSLNGEWEHLADAEATPGSNAGVIGGFALAQNYPNPFNPETTIEYSIQEAGQVNLSVFDLTGREVMTLVNEIQTDGVYSVKLNAASLASGIYFYQLEHNGLKLAKKMVLMK